MNQRDHTNLDGNIDMDVNRSNAGTESELSTGQILVSSLPSNLAPRPVHRIEVVQVVGLLAPRPRNAGVSPVETRRSPPVGWQRPSSRTPRLW